MKKFLLFVLLTVISFGASDLKAQQEKDLQTSIQKNDDVLVAYPNPTKDLLVLKAKDSSLKIKNVSFYSILGTPVLNYNINLTAAEINIDRLRPGKYLMKYTLSDNTQKIKQIIKL